VYILLIKGIILDYCIMIDRLYLTDHIFLNDNNKLYYETDNKVQEVKKHNWHRLLNEYGWEKLNKPWIKILNNYLVVKNNNSLFGLLDCGGDGDCLFHCISHAIKDVIDTYDAKSLRHKLSNNITNDQVTTIIDIYQVLYDIGDFKEEWDPYTITIQQFRDKINKGGNDYWGDFLMLNLLKDYLNVNFVILYSNDIINQYYHYPLFYEYDETIDTIILLYENESHFKLVGYFGNSNMNYLFNHQNIPREILKLINYLR